MPMHPLLKTLDDINRLRDAQRPLFELGHQPMRDLLLLLPQLPVSAQGRPDFDAAPPALLVQLAESAEVLQNTFNLGVAAIGQLLAHASPEIDDGTVGQDTVEAIGWLLTELGTGAAICFELSAPCRRHTADFVPPGTAT